MEGVERYKVRLLPHNDKWDAEYQMVRCELKGAWNNNIIDRECLLIFQAGFICTDLVREFFCKTRKGFLIGHIEKII